MTLVELRGAGTCLHEPLLMVTTTLAPTVSNIGGGHRICQTCRRVMASFAFPR